MLPCFIVVLSIDILGNVNSTSVSFRTELFAIMQQPGRFAMLSFV